VRVTLLQARRAACSSAEDDSQGGDLRPPCSSHWRVQDARFALVLLNRDDRPARDGLSDVTRFAPDVVLTHKMPPSEDGRSDDE
jgi:hypothetical protein